MPFLDNNRAVKLPTNSNFQVGISDYDLDTPVEQDQLIEYTSDPSASYVYYDCSVECMLDSGIVVHNRLPQVNNGFDTLSTVDFTDPNMDIYTSDGVNLKSKDQYADIVQRMGHARYYFRLWGQALRFGFQIPIPRLVAIGGVPAIPYDKNPQLGYNRIFPGGNFSGVILWEAAWSLWYTTAIPPVSNTIPASDPAASITGTASKPTGMQAPWTSADDNAVKTKPNGVP